MGVLLALLPLALAARLALILRRPLWADEIFTAWAARLPWPDLLAALRRDSGPPAFYLLEKPFAWAADAAGGDAFLRALPFLAALLLLFAARGLPDGTARRTGILLFGAFALINAYSAEARAYAWTALLALCLFRLTLEREETPRRLAATLGLGTLILYTHYLAIPVVVALILMALARRRAQSALALAGSALLFAPWVPVLSGQPPAAIAWMREPAGASLLGFLSALGGVGRIPLPFGPPLPPALPALGLAAGAWLTVAVARAAREDRQIRDAGLFVAAVLGGALAISLWKPFAFAGRTEMAALAVWIWAVARAAGRSAAARWGAIAAACLGLTAAGLLAIGPHPPSAAARAARALEPLARPGDTLVAGPGLYLPFRLAADRGRLAPRLIAFPAEVAEHPGWWSPAAPRVSDRLAIESALRGSRSVFLLLPPGFVTPELSAMLRERGSVRELPLRPEAVLLHWTARRAPDQAPGAIPPPATAAPRPTRPPA